MATLDVNVTASIDASAKSTGGNEAADAGKLLVFNTEGQIQGSADSSSLAAVKGTASGSAYGVHGESVNGAGVVGVCTNGNGVEASSINSHAVSAINFDGTDEPLHVKNANVANTADLATFRRNDNLGVNIKNDGGLQWTTATGAGTTRTNLGLGALALQGDGDKGDITVTASGATWTLDTNTVGEQNIKDAAVSTSKIADNAVTFAKLEDIPANHLIGRHTAGNGDPQSINIDGGLELNGANIRRSALTGDVTASAGDNATTIANDAVTNAKLSNMAEATIKGRQAGSGTGDPEDLTATQARTALGLGTAALANTGTGSGDVPTIAQADARYAPLYAPSFLNYTGGSVATTSTSLSDIDASAGWTGVQPGLYRINVIFTYNAAATTTGALFSLNGTAGASYIAGVVQYTVQIGDRSTSQFNAYDNGQPVPSSFSSGNQTVMDVMINITSAGDLALRFRTEIAGSAITITNINGFLMRLY